MLDERSEPARPRIAVVAGPTATILNTPLARTGTAYLRPQKLAEKTVVHVEQFSAHPLERDAAALFGPPDAYLRTDGVVVADNPGAGATPLVRVELDPADGLYLLPYMSTDVNGKPWGADGSIGPGEDGRQTFFPDAKRLYMEIDRFAYDENGESSLLSRQADFAFFRAGAPGGFRNTPDRDGKLEVLGRDYFPYGARDDLRAEPTANTLAEITNLIQQLVTSGEFAGVQWLEGSPVIEETLYWLNLLIDTAVPVVGHAAIRTHGTIGGDGPRNIVDGVRYITSRVWADRTGRDEIGAVLVGDELVYAARELVKESSRPGGYRTLGEGWGVLGVVQANRPVEVFALPTRLHTHCSDLRLTELPREGLGVARDGASSVTEITVPVLDSLGGLRGEAIPHVRLVTTGRYHVCDDCEGTPDVIGAYIEHNLVAHPLAGFVSEGLVPNGSTDKAIESALARAAYSGMPVVKCGRGNQTSVVGTQSSPFIGGSNLTGTKARILLMAALLRLGALPPAADPTSPTAEEIARTEEKVAQYQRVFDTH